MENMDSNIFPSSPVKRLVSNALMSTKTSITCTNVPVALFDATAAKKHFTKFGRVQKIRLFPKKQMCIVVYDQPSFAEKAVLNAGAFEGNMFDVTRTKPRVRKRSKKDDDPDWLPDSDVEDELAAMSGGPSYRITRQKPMEIESEVKVAKPIRTIKQLPSIKKTPIRENPAISHASGIESPVPVVVAQTTMSTMEAAAELHQLRSRISFTPDEQWRTLDARDKILRAWGGTGSRVKVGGATIGTCQDMCPEKELLHRQAEHQVLTLETVVDSDGQMEPWRAVKQYSRSSADQEIPMCYELRPAAALMRTCAYLLHEIADTKRQVTLADWFHFMWDRFRGIRKDITQQALCCSESIRLVEICARFHAHCAARLADLEHTQFDQKLNTDNLTKCLQTLKHMYADVGPEQKPREAEFRGYIALLNLGDANFWWEIKQLPLEIQKSEAIVFAMQVFNALDNNNYVRFFRLVKEKATYLQACILLRYFNDVRARALARIVKAFAPRGGSRYPAEDLMNALAFESIENMKSFVNHYGIRFAKVDDSELTVILDRNQFIEDSDPYPIARAVKLIESKRHNTVGEVIAGGPLPPADFRNHVRYSSFTTDGRLKDAAFIAEEQGYNTINDSNKDIRALKSEMQRLSQGGRNYSNVEYKSSILTKPQMKAQKPQVNQDTVDSAKPTNKFIFQPAIVVAPKDIQKSPGKMFEANNNFIFSKPQEPAMSNSNFFETKSSLVNTSNEKNIFSVPITSKSENDWVSQSKPSLISDLNNKIDGNRLFRQPETETHNSKQSFNIFASTKNESIFTKPEGERIKSGNLGNIFMKPTIIEGGQTSSSIFANFNKTTSSTPEVNNIFSKPDKIEDIPNQNSFNKMSPGSLFKSACNATNGPEPKAYSIFQTKNKEKSVAADIFKSVTQTEFKTVYDFDPHEEANTKLNEQWAHDQRMKEEEERLREQLRREEQKQEELRRQEEEKRKCEELKQLEEKRRKEEERKQEELKRKIEEERKAKLKRKAEEERKLMERIDKESVELVEELVDELKNETVPILLKDELRNFHDLVMFANTVSEEIVKELCDEISQSEMMAEKFFTDKLMKKWFAVWRSNFLRNYKRRSVLENTPVWLAEKTPIEEAANLKRHVENAALKNMNAIHRGYKFKGELKQLPPPDKYNIMEIIKSPLLKRMKNINYPYDKCFFWKVTLVAPRTEKWLCRKIDIEKWLLDAFSDNKKHDESDSLIHVGKQSWNNLMEFAISASLVNKDTDHSEAMEGTNGVLFYFSECEKYFVETINDTLKHKYPYQIIPVTVIIPKLSDQSMYNSIESLLTNYLKNNCISAFRICVLEPQNLFSSLNTCTKSALKWMAKKYPQNPNLETDYLKFICQRYLANEIWCRLKSETDERVNVILKDLKTLIKCYNLAIDKLIDVITNEDLFNYPPFPLEFKAYLDNTSPYPKPYEFIASNARNSENTCAIRDLMKQLKLPDPVSDFHPVSVPNMQQQIRKYCNQIRWFENPEQVVCKVVAVLPNQFMDLDLPCQEFTQYFAHYNLADFLNVIVYEKINRLNNFENRYAIYDKSVLQEYCNMNWLYEENIVKNIKHKAIEYEDELDYFIEAKRRKLCLDSMEILMLEDKDATLVEENIKASEENISKYNDCEEAVKQLEKQLEEEQKKSIELENLLRIALSDV